MIVSKLKQTGSQARRRHQRRVGSAEQPVNFRLGSEAAIRLPACERPFLARFGRLSLPFFRRANSQKKFSAQRKQIRASQASSTSTMALRSGDKGAGRCDKRPIPD